MFGLFKKDSKKQIINFNKFDIENGADSVASTNLDSQEVYGHNVAYYYIKVFSTLSDVIAEYEYIRKRSAGDNSKCSDWVKDMEKGMVSVNERLIKMNELPIINNLMWLFIAIHIHNWMYQTEEHDSDAYPLFQKYINEHSIEEVWDECFPTVPLKGVSDKENVIKIMEENAKSFLDSLDDLDRRMMFNYDYKTFIQEYFDILGGLYIKYDLPENTEIKKEKANKKTREVFDGFFSLPIYDDNGNQVN